MTISSRRIEWIKKLSSISVLYNLVFGAHFCPKASHGQCSTYGLKTTLKLLVHVLAIMANSYLKIVFSQKSGMNLNRIMLRKVEAIIGLELCEQSCAERADQCQGKIHASEAVRSAAEQARYQGINYTPP